VSARALSLSLRACAAALAYVCVYEYHTQTHTQVAEGLESIVAGESSLAFAAAAALFYLCQVLHVH
jgi:hypothetical protein